MTITQDRTIVHATDPAVQAANGVDLRLMNFGFEANLRYPYAATVPVTTLINSWLEVLTDETEDG